MNKAADISKVSSRRYETEESEVFSTDTYNYGILILIVPGTCLSQPLSVYRPSSWWILLLSLSNQPTYHEVLPMQKLGLNFGMTLCVSAGNFNK